MNKKFNILYKTTNIITGEYYIGKRSTDNLNDNYFGSGIKLKSSIEKYGKENHKRETLSYCNSPEEAFELEAKTITLDLLKDELCMNLNIGGHGGSYYRSQETREKISDTRKSRFYDQFGENGPMWGKSHSKESKEKIGKFSSSREWITNGSDILYKLKSEPIPYGWKLGMNNAGSNNPASKRMWITNGVDSKFILKEDNIPLNWKKGMTRKTKQK